MKYKAIFFDFDGTLISLETHKIPDSALEALSLAKRNGVKIFLATGRHPLIFMENSEMNRIDFDAYLTSNGQLCYDNEGVIHTKGIRREDKAALVELLKEKSVPVMFLAEKEIYLNMTDERVTRAKEILRSVDAPVMDISRCLDQEVFALLLYGGKDEEDRLMSVMPHCKTVRWHPTYTDVIPLDGGKDVGIDAMIAHYGIKLEETIAIGDAHNDIDMIKHAGLGIVMGNAADYVKDIADYVTDSVDEDGVYNALKHFGVI